MPKFRKLPSPEQQARDAVGRLVNLKALSRAPGRILVSIRASLTCPFPVGPANRLEPRQPLHKPQRVQFSIARNGRFTVASYTGLGAQHESPAPVGGSPLPRVGDRVARTVRVNRSGGAGGALPGGG